MKAKQQQVLIHTATIMVYLQASRLDQGRRCRAFNQASRPEDLYCNGQVTKHSEQDETRKELLNFLNASQEFQASCKNSQRQALQGSEKESESKAAYEALQSKCMGRESCVQKLEDELAARDKALVALTLQMQGTCHQTVQEEEQDDHDLGSISFLSLEIQASPCLIKSNKPYASMPE